MSRRQNDYVNVLDIKNGLLYSKDHYVFAYIRVPPLALELMSIAEQEVIIRNLAVELSAENKPFKHFSISRPVNISGLIDDLTDAYLGYTAAKRKLLNRILIQSVILH